MNGSTPLVQLSLSDLKQVYLEAMQAYHQQVLLQAVSQLHSTPFNQTPGSNSSLNLAQLLQLQMLAQQQLQTQPQNPRVSAAVAPFASFPVQASGPVPIAPVPSYSPVQQHMNQLSSSQSSSVFAVPRPMNEDQRLAREARIQKYRAKRLKRKYSRPATSIEKQRSTVFRLRDSNGQFIAARQEPTAELKDLENKLAVTETECEKLRNSLSAKENELAQIKTMLDDQMRRNHTQMQQLQQMMRDAGSSMPQFEEHAMHLAAEQRNLQFQQQQVSIAQAQVKEALSSDQMQVDSYPSPMSTSSASAISSPVTPATPMMTSSPTVIEDDDNMDTSGSSTDVGTPDEQADERHAKQLLAEKLKKLGGPPSDVYYPYWPGVIMHPAFMQKEDWTNMTLRPTGLDPDVLEQERQRYFEAQRRWQQEQEEIAALLQEHPELLNSRELRGALNWRSGYWSGNWVPAAEKIDFTKIELRKTPDHGSARPRTTTSEAVTQLHAALSRRAALEAAAMSAVSSAQHAVSSSSSSSVASSSDHRSPHSSSSPRSPALGSLMPIML